MLLHACVMQWRCPAPAKAEVSALLAGVALAAGAMLVASFVAMDGPTADAGPLPTVLIRDAAMLGLFPAALVGLAAAASAWMFRGGFILRYFDIAVQDEAGQAASRAHCALRCLVAWSPVYIGLFISLLFLPAASGSGDAAAAGPVVTGPPALFQASPVWLQLPVAALPLVFMLLLLVGVVVAIVRPSRGWHDEVARTWLVPSSWIRAAGRRGAATDNSATAAPAPGPAVAPRAHTPLTPTQFRTAALRLPEATEGSHMGHADFRVRGKIFATLGPEDDWAMVKLPTDAQAALIDMDPATCAAAKGAWGSQGATVIQLRRADVKIVQEALAAAWRRAAPKGLQPTAR